MKKIILTFLLIVTGMAVCNAQNPFHQAGAPIVQQCGVDMFLNYNRFDPVQFSDDSPVFTVRNQLHVYYERGIAARLRGEAGLAFLSENTDPGFFGPIIVPYVNALGGLRFNLLNNRTFLTAYFGLGFMCYPEYGVSLGGMFDFRLVHYLTGQMALNVMIRSASHSITRSELKSKAAPIGIGLSYQF